MTPIAILFWPAAGILLRRLVPAAIAAYLALPVRDARVTILVLTLVGLIVLSLIRREHMGEGFMRAVRRIPRKKHDSRRR